MVKESSTLSTQTAACCRQYPSPQLGKVLDEIFQIASRLDLSGLFLEATLRFETERTKQPRATPRA